MTASQAQPAVFNAWLEASRGNRGTERFRVSLAAFRAIAAGRRASPAELARAAAMDPGAVERTVQTLAGEGRIMLDRAGAITGAGGLSLVSARHSLTMFGRRYWVWCALDAVGIPAGLGADARVESVCEDSGNTVVIEFVGGVPRRTSPPGLWISLVAPTLDEPLYDCCCSQIRFYADAASMPAGATPTSIGQTAELGGELWRDSIPL